MYAKVFRSLWDGTLAEPWQGWVVFTFMLAHCDPEGYIDMTHEAIARRSCLPIEVVREGVAALEAPDPSSRTEGHDGCRLERIDGHRAWGWRVVNLTKYRTLRDAAMVRQQTAERVRRHRAAKAGLTYGETGSDVTHETHVTRPGNARKRQAEAYTEAKTKTEPPPTTTAAPAGAAVSIALKGGKVFAVSLKDVAQWQGLYPSVNVEQELNAMVGWCEANPSKRKVDGKRFVNAWLSRTQHETSADASPRSAADASYLNSNRGT